jgi:membrane protein YqaA with SNARE-associated domain
MINNALSFRPLCGIAQPAVIAASYGAKRVCVPSMHHLLRVLYGLFRHFGGAGLLVLGVLDSSFLFAPLGNDLLVVALTARYHSIPRMLYYAGMSTAGSVLGCLLVDLVFRKAGERGLEKHLPRRRLDYVKNKVNGGAAIALVVASLAPPPFPFTPFVMAASALQYPRKKLLMVVGAARLVRFTGLGVLAFFFGRRILGWTELKWVQWSLLGLIAVCVVGSAVSVTGWIQRSRRTGGRAPSPGATASA